MARVAWAFLSAKRNLISTCDPYSVPVFRRFASSCRKVGSCDARMLMLRQEEGRRTSVIADESALCDPQPKASACCLPARETLCKCVSQACTFKSWSPAHVKLQRC